MWEAVTVSEELDMLSSDEKIGSFFKNGKKKDFECFTHLWLYSVSLSIFTWYCLYLFYMFVNVNK